MGATYIYDISHLRVKHPGHAVVQLGEALRYKLRGRGFDFRWGPSCRTVSPGWGGVDAAFNKNKYQEHFLGDKCCRGVWLAIFTYVVHTSCTDCLEIGDPQRPESEVPVQVCTRIALSFSFLLHHVPGFTHPEDGSRMFGGNFWTLIL